MISRDVVLHFLEGINRHDPIELSRWMTEDHAFVDSLGNTVKGREKMREGWKAYFAFCPDYWVAHDKVVDKGERVAVFGTAGGTIIENGRLVPENRWKTPAAWFALIEAGLVKEWRVFADNKPVYDILARLPPAKG